MQRVQAGHDINLPQGDIIYGNKIINDYSEITKQEIQVLVNTHHLPEPTTALIGRQTELNDLTKAIKNPDIRLAIIVAAGGIGKSALTDEWLQQISAQNFHGKTRVFGWSFYSQGSHTTFANSQPFFNAVLPFLGIEEISKDEIEKARLLARCLQQQPCLLILDGLEPLQHPENLAAMSGELQDSALKEFIACLRQTAGQSFVLLSSRQPLVELKKWHSEYYLSLDLKTLPHDDGAKLLQTLAVTGNEAERQAISKNLNGHALSLLLMGHLLKEYHQGDCRYAKELPPLTVAHGSSDAEKDSRHALRVLDYYDSLQDEASRCFLQLLGLFDRPMSAAEKAVLITQTQHAALLRALTDLEWKKVEIRLEKSGLLLSKKGSFERLEWDTHPIIREYFRRKFNELHSENFKQAHWVLACYYYKLPEKDFPDTLEEMLPLYRSLIHSCLAGEYFKALDAIYWKRILRGKDHFSWFKLGAYIYDLNALAFFFPNSWNQPVQTDLDENKQAWLLGEVSYCLVSLGRLSEAVKPRVAALNLNEKIENWYESINDAVNLVVLYLDLGKLTLAHTIAKQANNYVQHTVINYIAPIGTTEPVHLIPYSYEHISSQCHLATVCHRKGLISGALKYFQQAETIQGLYQEVEHTYLSSLGGFWYCALLLDNANDEHALKIVRARAENSLPINKRANHLLGIALDYLTLARVHIVLNENSHAENYFDQAIHNIQKANMVQYISLCFLYRADFYLSKNQLDQAQADLNSAWDIIERCGMKLYAIDYLLIHGRYCLVTHDTGTALNHYEETKQLIQETGYHLRDVECDLFAAGLCQHQINIAGKNADYYLQKAKKRIEEIGQWGLLRVIKRDFPEYL